MNKKIYAHGEPFELQTIEDVLMAYEPTQIYYGKKSTYRSAIWITEDNSDDLFVAITFHDGATDDIICNFKCRPGEDVETGARFSLIDVIDVVCMYLLYREPEKYKKIEWK